MKVLPRTLRRRVLGIMFAVFLMASLSFMWVLHRVVTASFSNLERTSMTRDASRVQAVLDANIDGLRATSGDWAVWTATYDFVAGRNPGYPAENLGSSSLAVIGVDFMYFLDGQGRVVYATVLDPNSGEAVEPSRALNQAITRLNVTIPPSADDRGARSGFVALPGGTAAVVFEGISTSDGRAPPNGILVVGHYVDEEQVAAVERVSKLNVTAVPPTERAEVLPDHPSGSAETLGRVYFDTADSGTIRAWATVRGLDGDPALLYSIAEPRVSMQRASTTVSYVGLGLFGFVLLFGIAMGIMMEAVVMRRLTTLHDEVLGLSRVDVNERRVTVRGDDEIAELAVALNRSFDGLAEAEAALKHAAEHDYLTGLANRRRLEEDMEKAFSESTRTGEPIAYVVMDLDGFKQINDARGHQCGDAVLVWFAEILRSEVRCYSTVARVGGDEFAIMLPRSGEYEAAVVADRLLDALAKNLCEVCGGEPLVIDASVGIAISPRDGDNIGDLGRAADEAMYATKTSRAEDEMAS